MASNSRSETTTTTNNSGSDQAPDPSQPIQTTAQPGTYSPPVVTVQTRPNVYQYQVPQQQYPQYNGTQTSMGGGFGDIIPSILPAIQSGSYVLVLIGGFAIWSSRGLLKNLLEKHINLVEVVKESLDKQIDTNDTQVKVLQQLSENNSRLISAIEIYGITTPSLRSVKDRTEITQ